MGEDRDKLIELAARCEQATGADRALDVLIGCAVRFVPDNPGCEWAKADHWEYVPVPRISERIGCADKSGNVAAHWEAPAYTASLDAAMTLVAEGYDLTIDRRQGFSEAAVYSDWNRFADGQAKAATPALALCAAAIRSLATPNQESDNDG